MEWLQCVWTGYWELSERFYANGDPRANEFLLMRSYWPTVLLCVLYVWIMTVSGPRWMRHRPAWDLRAAMVWYNVAMVLWNAYLVFEMLAAGWWSDMSLGCEVVNPAWEGKPMRMVRVGYLYYVTKLIEMADTAFFLLRKRFHLISFLHVFHHTALPASVWFGIKFAPGIETRPDSRGELRVNKWNTSWSLVCGDWLTGGSGGFFPLVNSLIHVMMYTYYGIAAAGPRFAKYLWWKPLMTISQMLQFIALILHNQQFFHRPCDYPLVFCASIYAYAWIFLILFLNYFFHEHFGKRKGSPKHTINGRNGSAATSQEKKAL